MRLWEAEESSSRSPVGCGLPENQKYLAWGFESFPCYTFPLFPSPHYDLP
jgi:hypothetical protein